MKKAIAFIFISLIILSSPYPVSAAEVQRDTINEPEKITGIYDLILIGGSYKDDPDRIVILDAQGDGIGFKPVTDEYRVKRIKGLSAKAALEKTRKFFSDHCAYNGFAAKRLSLPGTGDIGYQLIPDYPTVLCEQGNEISVSYSDATNGIIKVYTWLLLKEDDGDWRD